jgi:hypothetical protein
LICKEKKLKYGNPQFSAQAASDAICRLRSRTVGPSAKMHFGKFASTHALEVVNLSINARAVIFGICE